MRYYLLVKTGEKHVQVKEILTFSQGSSQVNRQVKNMFQVKEILPFFQGNPWADAGWPAGEIYIPDKGNFTCSPGNLCVDAGWPPSVKYVPG